MGPGLVRVGVWVRVRVRVRVRVAARGEEYRDGGEAAQREKAVEAVPPQQQPTHPAQRAHVKGRLHEPQQEEWQLRQELLSAAVAVRGGVQPGLLLQGDEQRVERHLG